MAAGGASASSLQRRLARQQQRPRPRPALSSAPVVAVPRRVVAARRLLTALFRGPGDDEDDDELRPYLWRCGSSSDGGGGRQRGEGDLLPLPDPPDAWRRIERLACSNAAASPGDKPHPASLWAPLLAAATPPSALLPERAVLRHACAAATAAAAGGGTNISQPPCQLSRRGLLAPLRDRALEEFFARLFEAAVVGRRRRRRWRGGGAEEEGGPSTAPAATPPLPPTPPEVSLSRHDLFHAHLFATTPRRCEGRSQFTDPALGLLFHAAEYPKMRAEKEEGENEQGGGDDANNFPFPYDLGTCQRGSPLDATRDLLDWRAALYFGRTLAAFSVARGGPLRPLLRPGTAPLRTVYEEDLALEGWVGPDVLCFHARDVVVAADERRWGSGVGGGGGGFRRGGPPLLPPLLSPLPEPVETSLGPLYVFLSY